MKIDGRLFIAVIIALVLIPGACATTISTGGRTSPSDVQAKVNKPFDITLDSDPITGYSWTVDFDSHFLNEGNESYNRNQPGLIGSGGQQIFIFTPIRVGKTIISAVYKRPWENIVADERTFHIIVSR